LDAKFIEYPSDLGNLSGNRLPFAPKATGALTVRYETLLDGNLTAYAQGEGNVSAGYYTDTTNQAGGHQGSYAELNARIGMRQDGRFHWELGLWARNLTNRAVITDYNPTIAQNPAIFGGASFLYFGAPRTFGADVNIKF